MRPPREAAEWSATPIYDALCAEYRRLFRALPGDRSGEEHLSFVGFRHMGEHQRPEAAPLPRQHQYGRHRGLPPALPPARRDGRER
jgi:hypothetical protein